MLTPSPSPTPPVVADRAPLHVYAKVDSTPHSPIVSPTLRRDVMLGDSTSQ